MTLSVTFQRTDVLTELKRSKRVFMKESTNCARHMAWVSTLIFTKVRICDQELYHAISFLWLLTRLSYLFCDVNRYFFTRLAAILSQSGLVSLDRALDVL